MIFLRQSELMLILLGAIAQTGIVNGQRGMSTTGNTGPNFSSSSTVYGHSGRGGTGNGNTRGYISGNGNAGGYGNGNGVEYGSGTIDTDDYGGSGNGNAGGYGSGPSGSTSPSAPSGPSGRNRGRVVNNSILDPDEDAEEIPIMGPAPIPQVRYNQRQRNPSRQMTPGPSVEDVYNGMGNGNSMMNMDMENDNMDSGRGGMGMGMNMNTNNNPSNMNDGTGLDDGFVDNSITNTQDVLDDDKPKVHRFVSVHVPPPEPTIPSRPLSLSQPAPKPEVHYQIVFIKAPTPSPQEIQEIRVPPPPETKTMVYVLLKKPQMNELVRIQQQRAKTKPQKPEVFFIRYKEEQKQEKRQNQQSSSYTKSNNSSNSMNMNRESADDNNVGINYPTISNKQKTNGNNNPNNNPNPNVSRQHMNTHHNGNNNINNGNGNMSSRQIAQPQRNSGNMGNGNNGNHGWSQPYPDTSSGMSNGLRPTSGRARGIMTTGNGDGFPPSTSISSTSESNVADSEFSSHKEDFNENNFSLASYKKQTQRQFNGGGFSGYIPVTVTSKYGIVN